MCAGHEGDIDRQIARMTHDSRENLLPTRNKRKEGDSQDEPVRSLPGSLVSRQSSIGMSASNTRWQTIAAKVFMDCGPDRLLPFSPL